MDKKTKLLRILNKLSPEDASSAVLSQAIKQLETFNSVINIKPLLDAVASIEKHYTEKTSQLSTEVLLRARELRIEIKKDQNYSVSELSSRIADITETLGSFSKITDVKDIAKKMEVIASMQASIRDIQSTISSEKEITQEDGKKYTADIKKLQKEIDILRSDLLSKLHNRGGGNMNRAMYIGGANPLTKYTDINLKAGANVTITSTSNNTTKFTDVTISATGGGGGGGIVRSINSISTNTAAASSSGTDYVYLCTGTLTLTLPDASTTTNLYTIKNVGSGTVTIATTAAQTIDGSSSITLPVQYTAVDLISDTANWNVT